MAYAEVIAHYRDLEPYSWSADFEQAQGIGAFFPLEYGLLDSWNALRGFPDTGSVLYPKLAGIDFRRTVPALQIPIYLMQGRHELSARQRFAEQWYRNLQARARSGSGSSTPVITPMSKRRLSTTPSW
jgi:hypothetical protein